MNKIILSALLLMTVTLQTAWAQGFRVYNSDGTVLQFSLRTDSIVFYDGIGSEQDMSFFTPVNQMIVGTWYKSNSESVTFYEDGTTDYFNGRGDEWIGASYEFFPLQGNLVGYSNTRTRCFLLHVIKLTKDSMIMGQTGASDKFYVYTRTQPKQLVTKIVLNETSINLHPEDTKRLTAEIYPLDADNKEVTWKSSNEEVAQVINNGLVVAISEGTCMITCGATDGSEVKASCEVKVGDVDYISYCPTWYGFTYTTGNYPNYVPGNPRNAVLNPGDSIHITAHQDRLGHLINATYYTWTICDENENKLPDTEEFYKQTNYDGYTDGANDPVGHLRLPAPMEGGRYCIKFVARYSYSGKGVIVENGNIVNNASYGGRITPQSGPTGGGAVGYLYFNVQ